MVSAVNTGVPLQGGTVNSPGERERAEYVYFDVHSTSTLSNRIFVTESPILIQGFGLSIPVIGFVQVQMILVQGASELAEDLVLNQRYVALTAKNNCILLDLPGVYRLRTFEDNLGIITVVGQQTAMSYWSWGLAAYANAQNQTDNPVNPP